MSLWIQSVLCLEITLKSYTREKMRFDGSVSMPGHQNRLGEVGPHDPTAAVRTAVWLSSGQALLKLEPCHFTESELSVEGGARTSFESPHTRIIFVSHASQMLKAVSSESSCPLCLPNVLGHI